MVTLIMRKQGKQYVAFEFDGHAKYDDIGKDIVCAGVSTLAQTALCSFVEVAGIENVIMEMDEAYLYCELPEALTEDQSFKAQIIMEVLKTGMSGISEIYPDNVEFYTEESQLIIEEVESDGDQV